MLNGFLLAWQFFTVLPIRKELPMGKKEVTLMYVFFPLLGGLMGGGTAGLYLLQINLFEWNAFLIAVVLTLLSIIWTGGLHLDGWADTADAYFSYQEVEKRYDILADPKLGAFGTMALISLLLLKVAFIYEAITQQHAVVYALIFIPLVSRALASFLLATTPAAKQQGLAAFFKSHLQGKVVVFASLVFVGLVVCLYAYYSMHFGYVLGFVALVVSSVVLFKKWTLHNFKGVTGDLTGAYIEGMEVVLWGSVLWLL